MQRIRSYLVVGVTVVLPFLSAWSARTERSFNDGWEFSRDQQVWRVVRVPHDWAIEGPFDPKAAADTARLPCNGVGYYRKRLVLDRCDSSRRRFLDFDGVMCDGTVYVNGQPCAHQAYGYLGMCADITPYVEVGTNTILVKADTTKLKSRWYPGAGIYRKVRMIETDTLYLDERELQVTTPRVDDERAEVVVRGKVTSRRASDERVQVTVKLRSPSGAEVGAQQVAVAVPGFSAGEFEARLTVLKPQLWEMTAPAALYTTEVALSGPAEDAIALRTGLRSFRFDADQGFLLNGKRVKLKGVNLHSDLGPLGMAFDRAEMKRRLLAMRDMGANALRTAHNPMAPEVLDLCDELGIFVWNECFDKWNETAGRSDEPLEEYIIDKLEQFVRRDRNHACVFAWSLGGEIPSGGGYAPGQEFWKMPPCLGTSDERCSRFRNAIRRLDTTRPVGIGSCFTNAVANGDYGHLDITGWNYHAQYRPMKARYPQKPVLCTETTSAYSEYGYYAPRLPTNACDYVSDDMSVDSYDRNCAEWGEIADTSFDHVERDDYLCGEFVWSGIDYLGEPAPYCWSPIGGRDIPEAERSRSSYFGICDLLGLPKDRYWLYRSHWNRDSFTLHLVPNHWNFKPPTFNLQPVIPVYVYTSAPEAELFVNGVSQGRRKKDPNATWDGDHLSFSVFPKYRLMWNDVVYRPGEVKVVAYGTDGKPCGERTLRTAGPAAKIVLEPSDAALPANCEETLFVKVMLADAAGTPVPNDHRRIRYRVEGPAEIVSVGNSNPRGYDSFKAVESHPLRFGRGGLYLRRTGEGSVRLIAASDNVVSARLDLK